MRRMRWVVVFSIGVLATARVVIAADVPVTGLKLVVVDKMTAAGSAKAVFVAKDSAITKGPGTDPAQIEATLDITYDAVAGRFDMPLGSDWLVNKDTVAKYVNKDAPNGGATKVGVIKPGALVKVVGKSLGDTALDIASAPTGSVYVAETIVNAGDETRLCTQFAGCAHKAIAGGTGHKLVCKGNSVGDAACTAVSPQSTTSTSTTTTSTIPQHFTCAVDACTPSLCGLCLVSQAASCASACGDCSGQMCFDCMAASPCGDDCGCQPATTSTTSTTSSTSTTVPHVTCAFDACTPSVCGICLVSQAASCASACGSCSSQMCIDCIAASPCSDDCGCH